MARLVDSDITKLAVLVGGVADIDAPTAEEVQSAKDITCAVAYGYTLGMTASQTVEGTQGLCDDMAPTRRGQAAYGMEATVLRVDGDDDNEGAYMDAAEIFADPDVVVDVIRRGGIADAPEDALPNTTEFATGQRVEVYRFTTDYPQYRTGQAAGQDATFQVAPLPTGKFNHDAELQ